MASVVDKIKKLLALAGNNPSDAEAQAAYAKAQKLMAEYGVHLSEEQGEEVECIIMECTHRDNCGYRKPLGVVIADNFRVKVFVNGGNQKITFFGIKQDVEIAVEVFNHAYKYAYRRGFKLERDARKQGYPTKGLANSYFMGFIKGLKAILDEQCKALMIVTPEEVIQQWDEKIAPIMKKGTGGVRMNGYSSKAYSQGYEEGKEHMRGVKSLE